MNIVDDATGGVAKAVTKTAVGLVFNKLIYLFSLKSHIDSIENERRLMLHILSEADSRRKLHGNISFVEMELVKQIRETTSRIDDLLDGINFRSEMRQLIRTMPWYVYSYKGTMHWVKQKKAMFMVAEKIQSLDSAIRKINSNVVTFGGSSLEPGGRNIEDILRWLREKRVRNDQDFVVGFDDYVKQIVRYLFDPRKEFLVISIEGLGGQGKTTLVRQVCKKIEINKYFKSFAWISIPRKSTKITLLMEIWREVVRLSDALELTNFTEEQIIKNICEHLKERKYLIILDNLWNKEMFDQIREAFPNSQNGSRIIVTTRDPEVSKYVRPCLALKIKNLNENQSWELICEIFSDLNNVKNLKYFEKSVKELVKKCGGISPLALVLLGGLISSNKNDESLWLDSEWENFPKENEKNCEYILDLSYDCLPNPYIKSCLLYISSFPEFSSVSVSKLFRLWVSEGFIQRESGQQEEIAQKYLNYLINSGLVQVMEKFGNEVKKICIHDIIRDRCIELARNYCLFKEIDDMAYLILPKKEMEVSRIIIQNKVISDEHLSSLHKSRTVIALNITLQNVKEETFKQFNLLRVLDLRGSKGLKSLINQIGKMKRLKYLGLRDTDVEKLPSSIQNLVLLETLDARGTFLKKVPAGIWKIRTLNHVFIRSSSLSIPASGTTSSLQTLWLHYGGVWHDTKRDLKKRDLLSQFVKEQAHLSYFKLTTHSDASIHTELLNKKSDDLRVLKLRGAIKENQLPDHSLFPQGIQELSLEFTHLKIDSNPIATLEKLRRLVTLKLGFMAFEGKSMHCSNNGFHELLHLQIHASLISEGWTVENGAMNKVEFLNITHCFDMKKIPDALRNLNGLKEVRFQWIRQEIKMRLKNKEGEDWEKIKHVCNIIFYDNWSKKKHMF